MDLCWCLVGCFLLFPAAIFCEQKFELPLLNQQIEDVISIAKANIQDAGSHTVEADDANAPEMASRINDKITSAGKRPEYPFKKINRMRRSISAIRKSIGDQSLCPWKTIYDFDFHRYPYVLMYAKCLTSQCNYSFADPDPHTKARLQLGSGCTAVKMDMLVYIKKKHEYKQEYKTDMTVACTCVRKSGGSASGLFDSPSNTDVILAGDVTVRLPTDVVPGNRAVPRYRSKNERRYENLRRRYDHVEPFEEYIARKNRKWTG